MSLFGTLTGLVVGVGSSAALMHSLRGQGLNHRSVPAIPLLMVLVIGGLTGVLCAVNVHIGVAGGLTG